ncbi:MAG UNVERIFIED_CONTAM: hypothetical protein LVR18_29595 [Planctomycetaceae bacterium]
MQHQRSNSATPLPLAILLGNFVVSGNPTRHIGYFDAPPGEPRVIEFEERFAAEERHHQGHTGGTPVRPPEA